MPKLSIIVPVYNVENYIEKCITSLLVSNNKDYEIIVVNDGTKDNSIEVVRKKFNDPRIRIVEQENAGLSAARNHGIAESKGEYLWFVDSDDWVETEEIPKMMENLNGIDSLYFGSYFTDYEILQPTRINVLDNKASTGRELMSKDYAHCAPYYLVRSQLLKDYNLLFKEGILHEDSLFTPILITHFGKIRRYETPVYHHLERRGSITQVINPKRVYDLIYVTSKLIEYGQHVDKEMRYHWGKCVAKMTNGLLFCTMQCEDKDAKLIVKKYVNNNKEVVNYLLHSSRNNRIMARLSQMMFGKLYWVYSVLYKIRYKE